uniref:ACB domain-containing protein n=1 Tax=Echeneis naucrates TaxID=173247 RepID=A0A665UMI7_ECHNA
MLMFYSYYKQATTGPCNIPRPSGFWDTRGKAKWDAWSSLGNMTREEAMKNYVEDIQLVNLFMDNWASINGTCTIINTLTSFLTLLVLAL